jgi:hypothetical protein
MVDDIVLRTVRGYSLSGSIGLVQISGSQATGTSVSPPIAWPFRCHNLE